MTTIRRAAALAGLAAALAAAGCNGDGHNDRSTTRSRTDRGAQGTDTWSSDGGAWGDSGSGRAAHGRGVGSGMGGTGSSDSGSGRGGPTSSGRGGDGY